MNMANFSLECVSGNYGFVENRLSKSRLQSGTRILLNFRENSTFLDFKSSNSDRDSTSPRWSGPYPKPYYELLKALALKSRCRKT